MSLDKQDGVTVLKVEGEMSIYRAAELKQVLLGALDASDILHLDLSAVTEFDSAGVQLLLLGRRTAEASRHEFRIAHQSAAVSEVLDLLDLATSFDTPRSSPVDRPAP